LKQLRKDIRRDVETRNAQRQPGGRVVFRFAEPLGATQTFSVIREGGIERAVVRFNCDDTTVAVQSQKSEVNFRATLTLKTGERRQRASGRPAILRVARTRLPSRATLLCECGLLFVAQRLRPIAARKRKRW
jgi:hypothetical protein